MRHLLSRSTGDAVNRMLCTDLIDSLPGDMLTKVDLMSMANSLEVRVPLLDHRVVELAFAIPGPEKLRRGITKHVLKETFKNLLPRVTPASRNRASRSPSAAGSGRTWVFWSTGICPKSGSAIRASLTLPSFRTWCEAIGRRKTDTSWMLWNLIVFQKWHDSYFPCSGLA